MRFFYIKDGFKDGEYSIYFGNQKSLETYYFGVSKKHEAETIIFVLNARFNNKGK